MMAHANESLRALVHRMLLTPSPLARYRPPGRRAVEDGIALFGETAGSGGHVIVLEPVDPQRVFALAASFFGEAGRYSIAVEVERAGAMDAALQAAHWRLEEEEPALVLERLPAAPPPPPAALAVARVEDEAGLADFRSVSETPVHVVPSLEAARDPDVALLVGYVDGRPVATARLDCHQPVAEILGVVTRPAYRRRGFGTAMTWAAIMQGAARGCAVAALTATAMGYPVYLRMGFVPVCTYRTYVPPPRRIMSGSDAGT